MGNFLLVLQAIPLIVDIVKTIEGLVPIGGQGKQKLDAVIEMVLAAVPKLENSVPTLVKIISAIVGLANKTGVFVTSGGGK